jgi:aspartyl-tRNA(Asn)/glutamyl-tRNA(Gln) amidotransferase subunit B
MEKGNMRLEPNISLRKTDEKGLPNYKVEVKNINSFGFVGRAIDYEVKRQSEILDNGKTPIQETRGYVEKTSSTVSQRIKEEASDYRYFPEPDLPPIRWTKVQISDLKSQIPELPEAIQIRFRKVYGLSRYDSEILTRDTTISKYFEEAIKVGEKTKISPKQIANLLINKKTDINDILPAKFIEEIIKSSKTTNIKVNELNSLIEKVLNENPKAVEDYKKGKETVIMFLVGQVMRQFKDKVDAEKIKAVLTAKLK